MSRRNSTAWTAASNNSDDAPIAGPAHIEHRSDRETLAVPDRYRCPITRLVMNDPVRAFTRDVFERAAIEAWFTRRQRCPITGVPMPNKTLVPDMHLRKEIEAWKAAHKPESDELIAREGRQQFLQFACESREHQIVDLFNKSYWADRTGYRDAVSDSGASDDLHHLVFTPIPIGLEKHRKLGARLKFLSRAAPDREDSAAITKPQDYGGVIVRRPVRRQIAIDRRPPLGEDVKNFLAKLQLGRYKEVVRDWGFVELALLVYLNDWHLAEMGLPIGARLALRHGLDELRTTLAKRQAAEDALEEEKRRARASQLRHKALAHSQDLARGGKPRRKDRKDSAAAGGRRLSRKRSVGKLRALETTGASPVAGAFSPMRLSSTGHSVGSGGGSARSSLRSGASASPSPGGAAGHNQSHGSILAVAAAGAPQRSHRSSRSTGSEDRWWGRTVAVPKETYLDAGKRAKAAQDAQHFAAMSAGHALKTQPGTPVTALPMNGELTVGGRLAPEEVLTAQQDAGFG